VRIALDAMGGDYAPAEVVQGAVLFAREHPQHEVILVGHERRIHEALREELAAPGHIAVHHASETVEMGEHPGAAIRRKKDSSIRVCFELIKAGEAAAMVSAGNSGAVMAGALLVLGRIPSIDRPAFAALFPALKGEGRCLLLDAGANVECKPAHLAQFALMGEVYVRRLLGVRRPRVAILSNGEETSKGTPLTRSALDLLRQSDLHVLGYVEGKDIFSGEVEVVVTDGFTGNVVLKTSEGAATAVAGLIRSAVQQAGLSEKLGALLLKPTLAGLRKVVDYAEYGGAPVLGVAGVAIVAHGRSHARAVKNALRTAMQACEVHFNDELGLRLRSAQSWLPARVAKRIKGGAGTLEDASE
jgi:glycerol-3-phosphate acyltransferase PlsX